MAIDPRDMTFARILIVAPHPDDESLGCGGLISILAAAGRRFHTIFVTDGGASHRHSQEWPRVRLAAKRECEAEQALDRLGVADHPRTFLRLPDADMPQVLSSARRFAEQQVVAVLQTFRPQLIVLPWRRDPHRDHRDSWLLATDAIAQSDVSALTLEYSIWLEELGAPDDYPRPDEAERIAFDVAAAISKKRAGVLAHQSQTTDLISDDPNGFRLSAATIDRLTGPRETYWRPLR